jgi:hypothetical protein
LQERTEDLPEHCSLREQADYFQPQELPKEQELPQEQELLQILPLSHYEQPLLQPFSQPYELFFPRGDRISSQYCVRL